MADLKPGNLLLSRQGDEYRVKLCDFGLSSIKPPTQEVLKDLGGARGTPMYMSPGKSTHPHCMYVGRDLISSPSFFFL